MKALKILLAGSILVLLCSPVMAQDGAGDFSEPGDGGDAIDVIGDPQPLSCYGYAGSVNNGDAGSVSFCATSHSCNMEVGRAGNAICAASFGAKCAARPCPDGQECIPIQMAGSGGINLTNCRRLPAPEGVCATNEICACDYNLTQRLDCGCQCS